MTVGVGAETIKAHINADRPFGFNHRPRNHLKIESGYKMLLLRRISEGNGNGAIAVQAVCNKQDAEQLWHKVGLAESAVAKRRVRGSKSPSQTWKTFLANHAKQIAAIDFGAAYGKLAVTAHDCSRNLCAVTASLQKLGHYTHPV